VVQHAGDSGFTGVRIHPSASHKPNAQRTRSGHAAELRTADRSPDGVGLRERLSFRLVRSLGLDGLARACVSG
jgi:hypothetical protein